MTIEQLIGFIKDFWALIAAVVGICGAVYKYFLLPEIKRRKEERKAHAEAMQALRDEIKGMRKELTELGKDVGFLQHDRLRQGHDHWMKLGYCPPGEKEELVNMYDHYIKRGRNSLHKSYRQDLIDLPPDPDTHWGARAT